MNGRKLQDRLYLALGLSARHIGHSVDAYRPSGPSQPLSKPNRFLKLPVAFMPINGSETKTNSYGDPLWYGIFDASYTRPGDYLISDAGTFFVASQEPLLPILCIRANRTISIARPNIQFVAASNSYGGYTAGRSTALMESWPASVLSEGKSGSPAADLPTDQTVPCWNVLLPAVSSVVLSPGDIITDDLGRSALITASEVTNLGWRMSAKMATT